jgi:hypothetical protein
MRGKLGITILLLASSAGLGICAGTPANRTPPMGGMSMEHTKPSGPVGPLKITFWR